MGLLFNKTGSEIIKGGSIIGNHEINIYHDHIVAKDSGGIFVNAKTTKAYYRENKVKLHIKHKGKLKSIVVNEVTFKCKSKELEVTCSLTFEQVDKLLFNTDINQISFENSQIKVDGLLQHPKGLSYIGIEYLEKNLKLVHEFGVENLTLNEIHSILSHSENVFIISMGNANYKVAVNMRAKKILEQVMFDLKTFEAIGASADSVELKLRDTTCLGLIKGKHFEIYNATTLKHVHTFDIANIKLYLGATKLLIQHEGVFLACENNVTKKLFADLKIIPKKLHQFQTASFLMQQNGKRNITDLVCFLEQGRYKFYSIASRNIITSALEEDVKVSEKYPEVIVLPDGLLHVGCTVDFVQSIKTPAIYFSDAGFPMYFERLAATVRISIPDTTILEETVDAFYNRRTKQEDNNIIVYGIANSTICLPLATYKSLYKAHLYELRLPTLEQVHTEKVLLSRARNMSDLLLFEFFGQWQIILDYVKREMMKTSFTEEQITQYGLYLYHATFQQRKRMEELSSKYPQFMYALSQELMVNPKLNQIYQKQQREMFQLAAQMKSQFTEIESLLSQITYIHFNNDEYQKRLKAAQNAASKKKVGVSVAAGIGIGIATGGIGLLIPAMTLFTEWINSGHRKELDAIQQEKEFKKNEFLFKKAIDLILHMNDFTINYHVQMLNQFTYNNLRLEAEVLAVDNSTAYKEKLLKQSIDMYTKTSLPIDYDTQLKPKKLVESILAAPAAAPEKTVSLFLE